MEQVVLNLLNMFGTGKDIDTGKAYVTFLGQESKKTVADIKTAFTELEQVGKYSGNGASVNDKGGLLGAFLLGNANTDYNISGSLKADCNALTEYFRLIKSEGYDANDALDLVKNTVPDVTESFEKFAKGIDVSGKSLTECITEFIPSFIKQVTHATTVTKILGNVMVGLGSALKSIAVTAGITLAITALGKAFGYLGTQLKEKIKWPDGSHFFYSMEEMTKNAKEAGAELDNTVSSIDSYKSKISELKESLDSGTLSESEAYDARKNLISIQDELVEKFGSEVNGLDLVNGSLETQIGLLDELSKTKARVWLNDPDNAKAIKQAQTQMSVNGIYDTDSSKYDLRASTSGEYGQEWKQIQDLAKKYGLNLSSAIDKDGNISFGIHLTADATSAEKTYSDFINDVSKNTLISDSLKDQLNSAVGDLTEKASGIISENSDLAEQAAKAQIQLNDTWSKTYSDLTEAQQTYNDAVAKNDDKAIAAALKKVKAAQEEFANTDIDNSYVQQYMQAQADQLDSATKLQAVQTGLAETFKGAESNYKSLNDYLGITNQKAKQLTNGISYSLNELSGLDDIDILNIGSLEKAGSATKQYSDEQIDSYYRLKYVADQLGISMDDLIDIFVKIGLVTSDNIKYTNDFTSSALTMANSATKAITAVTSALNDQATGVGVSTDAYSELIKDNAEYAAALEYSNGRMQLNREMATKLTKAKSDEAKANIEVAYSQNQMKYSAVKADMAAVDKQLKENNNLTDDQREKLEDAKAALESQSKTLRDNCTSLRMQYSALVQASSAYQDWLNAQNAAEAGDMYNDGMDAKQAIAAGLKNGKIGTEKYKAAVEFLVPDDFKGDVQTYIKKLNRYFKEASDGSIDASGLNNFITDSIKAGLMNDEGDGKIQMIADTTIEDFADALQLTPDAVQSIFGELQEYGWNFDWDSMLGNELDNTRMKLDDIKDQMADLDPDTEAWKILNDQAEKLQEKLDGLYEKSGIDQMVSDINDVLKDTGSLTGNQKDDLLGMGRVQTMVDLYDAQQRLIEAQKAFNANPGDLNIAQELTDAQKQVEELTQKKEKLGDPTALEIQVYTQDAIDKLGNVEGAADQVTDKLEKAGVLTVESDDDPVKETDKEIDNVQEKAKKPITLKVDNVQCLSGIQEVATALKDISGETTVTIRYKTFGKPASTPSAKKTYAEQRSYAYGGASNGGRTLVGELGNELVVNPHTGKWYTVGDNGAEFVDLPKDAIVFDHKKTEKLLGQGFVGARGFAYAMGNAKADGENSKINGGGGYMIGKNPATSKTYTKATKDNTKAVEENKKALEKQKKALEKQKEAYEKESNQLKIYGQAAISEIEKRITALNKEKDAQDKVYESQIKELEKRKEALQKANDEEDRAIKLAELQDALEKAKANRTVRIYNKNEGFVWRADQQAVSDAQNDLDDQKRQWKNDDILQAVDDEIERINNLKDAYDESIEAQIDDLDNMKDKWDEVISLIGTSWEDYQAQLAAAAEFNGMSLDGMAGALDGYKESVIANMQEIGATSAEIDKVTEAIEAMEEASSGSSGGGGSGGDDSDAQAMGEDDGSGIGKLAYTLKQAGGVSDETAQKMQDLRDQIVTLGDETNALRDKEAELVLSSADISASAEDRRDKMIQLGIVQGQIAENEAQLNDLSAQYVETIGNETTATDEARQTAADSLNQLVDAYGISYEEIFSKVDEYVQKLIDSGAASEGQFSSMSSTIGVFSEEAVSYLDAAGTGCDGLASKVQSMADSIVSSCNSAIGALKALSAAQGSTRNAGLAPLARYATGVIGAATTHIAITDEQGPEIKLRKPAAGNYSLVERGTSIIPAEPSANIWKMGLDPEQFISQHMPQRSIKSVEITQPDAGGVSVSVGDIQMYGVNDVESFGRVIHERVGTIFAQEFSRR
jgi:hypothetical protein